MRVFLPWKATNQAQPNDANSEGEEDDDDLHSFSSESEAVSEEEQASPRKRTASAESLQDGSDFEVAVSLSAHSPTAKRPRVDSELSGATDMTAGRVRSPSDSDDEKLPAAAYWPPLENEPQDPFSSGIEIIIRPSEPELNPASSISTSHERAHSSTTLQPVKSAKASSGASSAFDKALRERGLEIAEMAGDGNCLFRAVALQVFGDAEMHSDVRTRVCDFMEHDPEHFGPFVDEPLSEYIRRKRIDGVHGNNPEIQAISELFNRPVEVFTPDNGAEHPLNIFQKEYTTQDHPIRLSYHDGNHYNAVVDPLKPTAGLGLGMPDLKIGLADQMQVSKAIAESDLAADQLELKRALEESTQDEVKRVMKETSYDMDDDYDDDHQFQIALKESAYASGYDYIYEKKAMGLSDLDATNFELEQAILQSSLESYRRQELGRKQRASPTIGRRRRASPVHAGPAFASARDAGANDDIAEFVPPSASLIPAAAYAASASSAPSPAPLGTVDEYPQTVQELVMNGFELSKVARAYELIGDNFDDLLAFLLQNHGS